MAKKMKKKNASGSKKQSAKQASSSNDIVKLILEDHKPLKKLIKAMKSEKLDASEKRKAFEEFAPLLTAHAKAEEQALYTYLKDQDDLRQDGFEGQVEHQLADEMVQKCKDAGDEDLLAADIKILAELVEHHIEEEEEDVLPEFKKQADSQVRNDIGEEYLELKTQIETEKPGSRKSKYDADEARA